MIGASVLKAQRVDRQENQLLYYQHVSPIAEKIWMSQAKVLGAGGGNGASKTDTMLAKLSALSTGVFPDCLTDEVRESMLEQFRGPIAVRMVLESLTTTMTPVILPKLQWYSWAGMSMPGGDKGHYGWIPRSSLKSGSWANSWSEKLRTLRVVCRDPETAEPLGESVWQFMSFDQHHSDFASGDFHHVLHDELPPFAIWRENQARTMRVDGTMELAFTWPDDPAIPVDWVYDEVYEKGKPGPNKVAHIEWYEMWTVDNPNLDQKSISRQEGEWSDEVVATRLRGQPIRFSNRIHPLFTDQTRVWCLTCGEANRPEGCDICEGSIDQLVAYNHVKEFDYDKNWPVVWLLDPHPRKPHMGMWVAVDPQDDYWVLATCEVEGGPEELEAEVARIEEEFGFDVKIRLGDRNMLRSPSGAKRDVTWQDEFDEVGLRLDLSDVSDVGRSRLNDFLRVDKDTKSPRIHIHPRCANAIKQIQRYVWDEWVRSEQHDVKQKPKERNDDYPTLLKYLMNFLPTYRSLSVGHRVIKTK